MIPRRAFIATLGLGVLAVHRWVHAQASAKTPRIAFLGRNPGRELPSFKAFQEGLRSLGYVIGENVVVDVGAPAHDRPEDYSDLAAQFVAAGVDVLVAANPHALDAMSKATKIIPIVGVDLESDPVAKGWISSLARPGGNITGFFLDLPEMSGKQLQLLKEVKPALTRVAILGNPTVNALQFRATEVAAQGGGLTLLPLPAKTATEITGAITEAARQRAGALLVLSSPLIFANMRRIAETALKHQFPAINLFVPFFAEAGGLLAYGPDFNDLFRRAAQYADRVLKGAKPGDLPAQRPTKFEFVINVKTARALGLQLPQSLFLRADRVIE
jgi:putative ABC transport system substrate-binding protein